MKQDRIINNSNAELLTEQALRPSKLVMLKLENTFDFYAEEPVSITIQKEKNSKKTVFEEIIRIREWGEKKCCSWSIYSESREKISNVILRKVIWDKQKDKNIMSACNPQEYKEMLNWWPSINVTNIYIRDTEIHDIREIIENIDKLIQNGIVFDKGELSNKERKDMEYLRLYDWGQLHFTWASYKNIKGLSKKIRKLCKEFEKLSTVSLDTVASMSLNYSISIDTYNKIYILGEYD